MASATKPDRYQSDLDRAERIKRELAEFVTKGPLKETFELQQKLYFELADSTDDHEAENMLDWFLFEWFDEMGETVISHYLAHHRKISRGDLELLRSWEDSINTVFEILSVSKNSLRLKDLDSADNFSVVTSVALDQTPFKKGQYLAARLLPLGERFIFSGLQFIMADRQSAIEALQMRQALEEFDSPESMEKARREQCDAFCEYFGYDEISFPSEELNQKLTEFQHFIFTQRADPETGKTPADMFQERFGRELKVAEMPPPPESLRAVGEVTILCDEFDGLVLLPDYKRFKQVFEVEDPEREMPDWQELVWNYLKNPDIPIVAFERIVENDPLKVEAVLRTVLNKEDFSIEHLYAVLLHYKEPVEDFDDLEDDERLWDAFNGNGNSKEAPKRSQAPKKPRPKASARSKTSAPSKSGSSRKPKKSATPKARATAGAKSPARKTARAKKGKKASVKKR
jgi:hypothetical protein